MAQTMETWIIADVDALRDFYGQRFNASSIPRRDDVESIAKRELETALKSATVSTSKGEYHKIRHASGLLKRLNIDTVRSKAPHCERLFTTLEAQMA